MKNLLKIIVSLLLAEITVAQVFDRNIIGYYTSWSIYVRDYHVQDIPAGQINAINYASANISGGEIVLGDYYADIDIFYPGDSWDPDSLRGCFHQLQLLKAQHPHLMTLISVGGWTWSHYFSDVALTEASRSQFAASCVAFIQEYGFDGVDLDWEYPVSGGLPTNIYRPEDRENFTLLLAELRTQLDAAGDFLLTIAAPASPLIMENIEIDLIHPYLDWINIMTYDFHGPWSGDSDPVTGFNAALYPADENPVPEPYWSGFNLDAAVQAYQDLGVPSEKINPGLPFYGRAFGGVGAENNGLYQPYWGVAPDGTWENGVYDYWHLAEDYINQNGYSRYFHEEALVPWLYNPNTQIMISYDDSTSISTKCQYILDNDLGGAMFWEFSGDRNGFLLSTVYEDLIVNAPESCDLPGDVNGDGVNNILDIVTMVGFILGDVTELAEPDCADVNGDGTVDILDIIGLVNILLDFE